MWVTMNSMVLFSCRLVGWTPVHCCCASAVPLWEISGESPFSSRSCRQGKLASLFSRMGRLSVFGLHPQPLPTPPPLSPLAGRASALFSPPASPPSPSALRLCPQPCSWPNFSMHSSISAGGAFLWATLTRPQNKTSNFLEKTVGDTGPQDAVAAAEAVAVETEEKHVSGGSPPPPEALPEERPASSFRAELFPTCLSVPMISGTCRVGEQRETLKLWNIWVSFSWKHSRWCIESKL